MQIAKSNNWNPSRTKKKTFCIRAFIDWKKKEITKPKNIYRQIASNWLKLRVCLCLFSLRILYRIWIILFKKRETFFDPFWFHFNSTTTNSYNLGAVFFGVHFAAQQTFAACFCSFDKIEKKFIDVIVDLMWMCGRHRSALKAKENQRHERDRESLQK